MGVRTRRAFGALCLAVGLSVPTLAHAAGQDRIDRTEPLPKRLHGIDVVEQLDQPIPQNLTFVDEHGKTVQLRDPKTGQPLGFGRRGPRN